MSKTKADADVLQRVRSLAMNLWWSWNHDAQRLFESIDPPLWKATNQNPLKMLRLLAPERRAAIESDTAFAAHLTRVEAQLEEYMNARTWFQTSANETDLLVAYFCAEYAVHESLPQYSGGLGVLAGDHVKSASDLGLPFVAIGLLYRNGFYTHEWNPDGSTRVIYPQLDFADYPLVDTRKTINVPMSRTGAGGKIKAKIWRQTVGRVPIYLLDTDIPGNNRADRALTRHLYGGDREYRIRQEILLGVGGVRALDALGLQPSVFHLNEGHAAFCALERLSRFIAAGRSFESARRHVRQSTVFTTHTPVAAGNDRFAPRLALKYIGRYAKQLGIAPEELLGAGREREEDKAEEFCMTVLALRLAEHCNGVAALHGDTSRRMWTTIFNTDDPASVPIGSITNGVHTQTWLAEEITPLYEKYLKPKWLGAGPRQEWWKNARKIPDAELWAARNVLRTKLVDFVRERLVEQSTKQHKPLAARVAARVVLDPAALTIGFARRFATYKRAPLIFHDRKHLARILADQKRPVQLVFAGKAHPQDFGGQAFAQEIFRHAESKEFQGRVVLLENYDMQLGRVLTAGADVWLNNPLRPQEASGTSGMKPPLHGGLNCSILDGWWPEAFNKINGWSIGDGRSFKTVAKQNRYDADAIYDLLENQIVPEFYARDKNGLPRRWLARMKNSIATVGVEFNTHRMVCEYFEKYYLPASGATQNEK